MLKLTRLDRPDKGRRITAWKNGFEQFTVFADGLITWNPIQRYYVTEIEEALDISKHFNLIYNNIKEAE